MYITKFVNFVSSQGQHSGKGNDQPANKCDEKKKKEKCIQ